MSVLAQAAPGVALVILGCLAVNVPAIISIRENQKKIARLKNGAR